MSRFGVKQSDFSKGLIVTGSLITSGSQIITGSVIASSFTGSLLGTSSYALTSSLADSSSFASNAENLGGYNHVLYPRLNKINTFTEDQQVLISGSKEIGTFEGDTFYILDDITNAEIGLSNALSDFDGPFTAGIYVSSGSNFSTSSYRTAIEIPNGVNFPSGGLVSIKFPTNITGSLIVTNGASGSFSGSFAGNGSGLTNISASSIVGLNLAQIASGSVTASVDPAYGFKVNASASISGSLTVQGTITAQTLVVQTITSSQELVTGSLIVSGALEAYGGVTGSLQGTASWAANAILLNGTSSGVFATTGSNTFIGTQTITGSNGRLIYTGTTPGIYPTLAEVHANNDYPWLHRFYNDTFSTSSAIMAYFGHNDGRFVFHNESTESIGLQVNGYSAENGLLVYSDKVAFVNNVEVTGSLNVVGGITGSLQGTASWANNATSASNALTASYVNPLSQSVIISGSLSLNSTTSSGFISNADTLLFVGTASFAGLTSVTSSLVIENQTNPASLFLIKSGSTKYFDVESSGNTTVYSNLFIIRNFTNQRPVLTVSQSIVQFATQSIDPSGSAPNGGIWFTSTNMYVGLD